MRNCHKKILNDKDRDLLINEVLEAVLGYRIKDIESILNDILWHISDEYLLAYHDTITAELKKEE